MAAQDDLIIWKGADWRKSYAIQDGDGNAVDLTGWEIKSQIREKAGHDQTLILEFTVTVADAEAGQFMMELTEKQTEAITQKKGYYDIFLTDTDGYSVPYVYGNIEFKPTATDIVPE